MALRRLGLEFSSGKEPTNVEKYTYRVIWSEEDQEHVGLCAEFPSLSHLAPSVPEALNGIVALVADVVDDMSKSNETPPQALSLQDFKERLRYEFHRNCIGSLQPKPQSRAFR